jgi:succinate dehydrogenase / fumarate reductase cytochrome b subunit
MSLSTPTTAAPQIFVPERGTQSASRGVVRGVGTAGVTDMWRSSIGIKLVVAVTGCILLLYVIGHMVGNLQVFLGQDALNTYAEKLHAFPAFLWVVRLGMLAIAGIHIILTIYLALQNNQARPVAYKRKEAIKATLSSRTTVYSGLALLAFVLYHLMHYTWRVTNPEFSLLTDMQGRFDVYSMVILGFQNIYVSAAYIIAMLLLGYHLSHGIASVFQTIGWNTPRSRPFFERLAFVVATIIVVGNISMPVSILLGLIKLPGGGI